MLQQFTLTTTMGSLYKFGSSIQNILTKDEILELNVIGYTGKNSKGELSSFEKYLNTLGKGDFNVKQTKFDNGKFTEKYEIARFVPDSPKELSQEKRYQIYLELKKVLSLYK